MARLIQNPVLIFLLQVLGIIVLVTALWGIAIVATLSFGAVAYDPEGIVRMLIVTAIACGIAWWFYTRSLRRLAQRLSLAVPAKALGIPIVGEFYVISALISPR
jgi:hypothetical protein